MIINYTHGFAFIHIPKCAGTTMREVLTAYDETGGRYEGGFVELEDGVRINKHHIPLDMIERHFPEDFDVVSRCDSLALLRNPRHRFVSALAQYQRTTDGLPMHAMSKRQLERFVTETLDWLEAHRGSARYQGAKILFVPQRAFVMEGERQVVRHLFTTARVDQALALISNKLGRRLELPERELNQSSAYRAAWLRATVELLRPAYRRVRHVMPESLIDAARKLVMSPEKVKEQRDTILQTFGEQIDRLYEDDWELFHRVQADERRQV